MSGLLSDRGAGRRSGLSRLGRAGVAVLLAVSLSGCWLQVGHNAGNTRYNDLERRLTVDNVGSLSEDWTVLVDQTVRSSTSVVSEPIVSGNKLYVTLVASLGDWVERLLVRSYDVRSGQMTWERSLLPDDVSEGDGTVDGGVQPVTFLDGELWVPYWHSDLPDCGGRLAKLDPATGDILSSEETGRPRSPVVVGVGGVRGTYPILAFTESRGCWGPGGELGRLEGAMSLVVRARVPGEGRSFRYTLGGIRAFDATPTIAHGRVYSTARTSPTAPTPGESYIEAFNVDPCNGDVDYCRSIPWWESGWRCRERPVAGPDGTVLVPCEETTDEGTRQSVRAYNASSGSLRWQTEPVYLSGPAGISGIAVAGDTVYVAGSRGSGPIDPDEPPTGGGDAAGLVDAYQPASCSQTACEPSWTLGLGPNMPTTAPTVAGGVVYVGVDAPADDPPAVVGVDASGCGERWCPELVRVPLVDEVSSLFDRLSQLSVAQGRVFVAWHSDYAVPNGRLTALAPAKRK